MKKKGWKQIMAYGLCASIVLTGVSAPSTQAASKPKLNKTKATLTVGKKLRLKLKNTTKKVTWTSSAGKVAAVTKKGVVTAKKQGKATITAKSAGKKYTCKITVKKKTGTQTAVPTPPNTVIVTQAPAASARPTIRPTATANVSGTPKTTATAEISSSPTATATAEISSSPTATATAEISSSPTATATAEISSSPTATADTSSSPKATETADASSSPKATETTDASSSPTATVKASSIPSPTPTQGSSLSASHVKPTSADSYTLKVGNLSVRMGMTESEVRASIGAAPDRTDISPLGMTEYIYNPSGDYTNYLLIQFADGKVAGMSTISDYFCYDTVVSAGDSVSTLTGKGFGTGTVSTYYQAVDADNIKKGTSAYLLKQEEASVIAFSDYWGNKDTYGIYVFSNAYTLDQLSQPKKGTYSADVLNAMSTQTFEMLNAFRTYQSKTRLTRDTKADKAALAHSQALAWEMSDGSFAGDDGRLVKAGIDYHFAAEHVYEDCASGIAAAHSFIHKQDSRRALVNLTASGKTLEEEGETFVYTHIGVGAVHDYTGKIFVTFDIYNLFQ